MIESMVLDWFGSVVLSCNELYLRSLCTRHVPNCRLFQLHRFCLLLSLSNLLITHLTLTQPYILTCQLLRDEIGFSPLHHACKLENIALARVLIESESGKRALLLANNNDEKPIELCTSNFMKIRIEGKSTVECRALRCVRRIT